ncbi:MAG: conjugal transfer protein TraF [Endomicrobiales bacterium]|nr:conjugal transfer protein TraF [Endomicrobiales bacterium]
MNLIKLLVLSITICYCPALLFAESFKILGSRALGMGGAQVAVVGDVHSNCEALTQYWNPAALGMHKGFDLEIPIVVGVEATGGILGYVDDISDTASEIESINDAQESGSYINLEQLESYMKAINSLDSMNSPGMGMIIDAGLGLSASMSNWSISVTNFESVGVAPTIDVHNLSLGGVGSSVISKGKIKAALEDFEGIDFDSLGDIEDIDELVGDPSAYTADPESESLSTASDELADTIQSLADTAGVDLGSYSAEEIANALINISYDNGVSIEDIVSTVGTIKEYQPLVESLIDLGTSGGFGENNSNIEIRGISYTEGSFGYGRSAGFIHSSVKNLYIGGNVKYISGTVGYLKQRVFDEDIVELESLLDDIDENVQTSSNIGLDVGLLYETHIKIKKELKTRLGILGRNVNAPTFTQPDAAIEEGLPDKYTIDPQYRFGFAFWPMRHIILAFDYDLTENSTPIDNYKSRQYGLGIEFNAMNKPNHNIAVRVGALKNQANNKAALAYTFGLGFNIKHIILNLSGAISSEKTKIQDGTEIPSSAYAMLSLGVNY